MKRVEKGEIYWVITLLHEIITVQSVKEDNNISDNDAFKIGNYFNTKEQAETTAEQVRKVLKGTTNVD